MQPGPIPTLGKLKRKRYSKSLQHSFFLPRRSSKAHRSSMNPDDRSRGALKILQKLGVEDASKVSKPSVNYCLHDVRTGKQCGNCSMWLDRMSENKAPK